MFILLLCLAHIASSEITVQTESSYLITPNVPENDKNISIKTTAYTKEETNSSVDGKTGKNIGSTINENNSEVKLSFNDNTTALIKGLKASVEKLIAYLHADKPKPKHSARRNFRGNVYDIFPALLRKKRDVENTPENSTNSNIIPISVRTLHEVENVTKAAEFVDVTNESSIENDTNSERLSNETSAENQTETINGRRSFNSDLEIAKVVHSRLLSYVQEHISDTMNKIGSLRNIKDSYITNNMFNMGYILANVDLIEVNLKKLKESIDENKKRWTEEHILDVFDKVKYTNTVVTSLMTALRSILNASSGLSNPNEIYQINESLQRSYGK